MFLFMVPKYTLYFRLEPASDLELIGNYYSLPDRRSYSGDIWISDPLFSVYSNNKFKLIYYPLFDAVYLMRIRDELTSGSVGAVYVNSCDIVCPSEDEFCKAERSSFFEFLSARFIKVKEIIRNECKYSVFESIS